MAIKILFLFLLIASVSFAGEKGGGAGNGGGTGVVANGGTITCFDATTGARFLFVCADDGCNVADFCADQFSLLKETKK